MKTSSFKFWIPILIITVGLLVLGQTVHAHEEHEEKAGAVTSSESSANPYSLSHFIPEALFSHLHNKIIHIPVGFGLAAAFIILLGYKWPQYRSAIPLLLFTAAVFAIVAYFTGEHQSGEFEHNAYRNIVELHENMGITTALLLWAGGFLSIYKKVEKYLWIYAIILILVITFTGFLGGILATS